MCLLNNLKLSLHLAVRTKISWVCFCQLVMTSSEYLKSTYEVMHAFGQVEFVVYGLDAKFLHSSLEVGNRKASIHTLPSSLWRSVAWAWLPLLTYPTWHCTARVPAAVFAQTYSDRNISASLVIIWYFVYECASHGQWVSLEPSLWMKKRCLNGVKMQDLV